MTKDLTKYVTTDRAAMMLGVLPTSINHLIHDSKLKALKMGRDWLVFLPSLEKYRETKSKRGRPPSALPKVSEKNTRPVERLPRVSLSMVASSNSPRQAELKQLVIQ